MTSSTPIFTHTWRLASPPDAVAIVAARGGEAGFYWENPEQGFAIAAIGAAAEIIAEGPDRFERASAAAMALMQGTHQSDGTLAPAPLIVGGFGFLDRRLDSRPWREFPALRMFVPRAAVVRRGNQCSLTLAWRDGERTAAEETASRICAASRESYEPKPVQILDAAADAQERLHWIARVEEVRGLISRGWLRKVVLARCRTVAGSAPIDPAAILVRARHARPWCSSFWFAGGTSNFIGSTPEVLVSLRDGWVRSDALAGSTPRGLTPEQDRELGLALIGSVKNLLEHRIVVAAISGALRSVAEPLTVGELPAIRLLPEAQHLYTPISGKLCHPMTVLELASLLHPTPAVCGIPVDLARELIERKEPDRGWYTGAVGWMDAAGGGEFAVALRSALIEGDRMTLWAGAGIVEGSEAESEFDETEAKMKALLPGGTQ
ncbi:MAG TPA: isochorismate synthase [Candidatus Binataceae bacterium]|nr:isochorismate synthase [Candidatus Binataceae bacterium]